MFKFFYHPPKPISGIKILSAFLVFTALAVGTIYIIRPGWQAFGKILEQRKREPRLLVILPDNCPDCFDIVQVTDFLKSIFNTKYRKIKIYQESDARADLLIKAHKIEVLPTFVLQGSTRSLQIDKIFDESSIAVLNDGVFVYKNKFPPFKNLKTGEIQGRFGITFLSDKSCVKCYNVYLHEQAMENLAMKPTSSSTIDVSSEEGKKLVKDYNIKFAPTIILKGDLDAYQNLKELWQSVGTIEPDGAYIFRERGLDLMGIYKNIKTKALLNTAK